MKNKNLLLKLIENDLRTLDNKICNEIEKQYEDGHVESCNLVISQYLNDEGKPECEFLSAGGEQALFIAFATVLYKKPGIRKIVKKSLEVTEGLPEQHVQIDTPFKA
jgi:hypothetical protein